MTHTRGFRLRIGGTMLAAALLAVAILALPAIGKGGGNGDSGGPRAAGTIESFDSESGELVVALSKGGTISAQVVRRTRIRCGRDHRGERGESKGATKRNRRGAKGNRGRRGHCTVDALVPGTTVKRAEIVLTHGQALYRKVGLLPAAATS